LLQDVLHWIVIRFVLNMITLVRSIIKVSLKTNLDFPLTVFDFSRIAAFRRRRRRGRIDGMTFVFDGPFKVGIGIDHLGRFDG